MRFVTEFVDQPLHIGHGHAESRAGLRHHVLLNHDAAEVVRAVFQRDLADLESLRDPGALYIRNIVQVNPAQRLHPQIFVRADRRRFELRVLRLERPGDERGEACGR